MKVIAGTRTLYVDIDETLVLWSTTDSTYTINHRVVTLVQQFYRRGHTILAWSKGGAAWAAEAVTAAGIDGMITACLCKPSWYIDDKTSDEFMPEADRILP